PRLTGRSIERPESKTIRHVRCVRLLVIRDLDLGDGLRLLTTGPPVINSAPDRADGLHRARGRLPHGCRLPRPTQSAAPDTRPPDTAPGSWRAPYPRPLASDVRAAGPQPS